MTKSIHDMNDVKFIGIVYEWMKKKEIKGIEKLSRQDVVDMATKIEHTVRSRYERKIK